MTNPDLDPVRRALTDYDRVTDELHRVVFGDPKSYDQLAYERLESAQHQAAAALAGVLRSVLGRTDETGVAA